MFEKCEVNGSDCHEIYKFLRLKWTAAEDSTMAKKLPWNFAKFLYDVNSNSLEFFEPSVEPNTMKDKFDAKLN